MDKQTGRESVMVPSRRVSRLTWGGSVVALVAVLGIGVAVFGGRAGEAARQSVVEVYKSPTCGCCSKWVDHMRAQGFEVRATDTGDLDTIKASHGVPRQMQSCHTALVDGYVIEGHVPAADVQRLLRERPAIAGLAVPGMPIGSPGMEVPGVPAQPYDVMAFENDGGASVFATYGN